MKISAYVFLLVSIIITHTWVKSQKRESWPDLCQSQCKQFNWYDQTRKWTQQQWAEHDRRKWAKHTVTVSDLVELCDVSQSVFSVLLDWLLCCCHLTGLMWVMEDLLNAIQEGQEEGYTMSYNTWMSTVGYCWAISPPVGDVENRAKAPKLRFQQYIRTTGNCIIVFMIWYIRRAQRETIHNFSNDCTKTSSCLTI